MKLVALLFLSSCASYVNGLHRQIDRDEKMARNGGSRNDPYSAYREQGFKKKGEDKRPIANPNSISNLNPANDMPPAVKRNYRSSGVRTKADDFRDGGSSGSLWVDAPGGSLFTTDVTKNVGDIVIINVLDSLRGQISTELKRAFPESAPKKKPDDKTNPATAAAPATPAAPTTPAEDELETKVYDKISGVVAEEINKDFFLLRGKKEIIFRKEKRFIEVQALVSRKDILDNDTINSDKLVESRVLILR